MMRTWGMGILVVGLVVAVVAADDKPAPDKPEPPLRLKKKMKRPEPEKLKDDPDDKKKPESPPGSKPGEPGEGDPAVVDADKDVKETVARISRNMRDSKERLSKNDPGDATRQVQREIIKDLESLIEQSRRQQQQNQQNQQNQENQQSKQSQQNSRNSRPQRSQAESQQAKQDKQQTAGKKPGPDQQPQGGTNPGQGGDSSKEGMARIADLYKDVWGHLPETMRKEMDSYSRVEFMAKYNDLLKQYYTTIAEKGRKKGD